MTPANVLSPQHLALQMQLGGFLVIVIALRGFATSQGPVEEKPLLVLASVGAVIAIAAGAAIRRRRTRVTVDPSACRSIPDDAPEDFTAFPAGEDEPPRRRRSVDRSVPVGLGSGFRGRGARGHVGGGGRAERSVIRWESRAGTPK